MSMLDNALGLHGQFMTARSQRVEVLARNIANADTPHYKARDLDFKEILKQTADSAMQSTHQRHFDLPQTDTGGQPGLLYRVPFNVAMDGNTVELNVEQAQYGKAAADYQAALNFFQSEISGLRKALRGE